MAILLKEENQEYISVPVLCLPQLKIAFEVSPNTSSKDIILHS